MHVCYSFSAPYEWFNFSKSSYSRCACCIWKAFTNFCSSIFGSCISCKQLYLKSRYLIKFLVLYCTHFLNSYSLPALSAWPFLCSLFIDFHLLCVYITYMSMHMYTHTLHTHTHCTHTHTHTHTRTHTHTHTFSSHDCSIAFYMFPWT